MTVCASILLVGEVDITQFLSLTVLHLFSFLSSLDIRPQIKTTKSKDGLRKLQISHNGRSPVLFLVQRLFLDSELLLAATVQTSARTSTRIKRINIIGLLGLADTTTFACIPQLYADANWPAACFLPPF